MLGLWLFVAAQTPGCMFAEVDVSDVSVTQQHIVFPGVPAELTDTLEPEAAEQPLGASQGVTLGKEYAMPPQSFSYEASSVEFPPGVSTDLRARSVTLTPCDPDVDLGFVRRLVLSAIDPANPDEVAVVAEHEGCEDAPTAPDGGLIIALGDGRGIELWRALGLVYELSLSGDPNRIPHEPWAVDVTLSVEGHVAYRR